MNKKVKNKKNEYKANKILLTILILLFLFTLFFTFIYIVKYHEIKFPTKDKEIIEIKTADTRASIINDGIINTFINKESFKDTKEVIIEKINAIEIIPTYNHDGNEKITFDVRYNISKNDFSKNLISSNTSEVLVRFAYSYDNENWKYVNNVISTNTSNISPLIGNNYDIAGIVANLKIATNYELTTENNKSKVMYWKSETIFKNINNDNIEKELKANFTIEYKSSN